MRRPAAGPRSGWSRARGAVLWPALLGLCLLPGVLPRLVQPFSAGERLTFDPPLWQLTLTHLGLVLLATAAVLLLGLPLAVAVTRPGREALRGLTETLVGLGQTVPTFAVLALAVPVLGFGWAPTLLGLIVYGLVPVVSNGVAGLLAVDRPLLDAARGMGMTPGQQLRRVELPLALPVLLAGARTSTVYNVGTATVGAALGAGGLGGPIISGLSQQNTALVFVGAVLAALPVLLAGARTSTVYNVGTATVGAALGAGGLGGPIINGLSQQNTALVLVGAVLAALLALSLDALLGLIAGHENPLEG